MSEITGCFPRIVFDALGSPAWLRIAWFEIVERRRDPEIYAELP